MELTRLPTASRERAITSAPLLTGIWTGTESWRWWSAGSSADRVYVLSVCAPGPAEATELVHGTYNESYVLGPI